MAALPALWWAGAPSAVALEPAGPLGAEGTDFATIATFGTRGAYALRYVDHGYVTLRVPVRNDGAVAVTIDAADLGDDALRLLDPVLDGTVAGDLPVTLAAGESTELALTVRMDNCEFYTERAMDVFDGVDLDVEVLGRSVSQHLRFDHDLVVRSPMMVTCPDRVRNRDGNQRRSYDD